MIRTMSKLTLSVHPEVVSCAKRYAKERGLSISEMVETYLLAVTQPSAIGGNLPMLRALRGTLKKANVDDYRKHLVDKYR